MTFQNLQIDTDDLPRAADLEMEPMAPAYQREVLTRQLIIWGIVFLGSVMPYLLSPSWVVLRDFPVLPPLAVMFLAALIIPLKIKQARVRAIEVREHDVAYRSGCFFAKR